MACCIRDIGNQVVTTAFRRFHVEVFDADREVLDALAPNQAFGREVLDADAEVLRAHGSNDGADWGGLRRGWRRRFLRKSPPG